MQIAYLLGAKLTMLPGIFYLLAIPSMLLAQTDSSILLTQIEVTAERFNLTDIGKHTDKIDSNYISHRHATNLASLLSMNTPLFIRSYGAGTLATVGIRGGNASHTQILWNGIPIRNPMLGLIDLALLPSAFIDEAEVHYGGHGAAFGSGAVGGLISLSNDHISLDNQMSFQFVVG
ncbi:MAG: TonB-dependent receptor plug domain-containing protein, partial [Saprospiraceae bacterium]